MLDSESVVAFRKENAMRRWDQFQESYMEEDRARGVSREAASYTESRLDRWGRWLKKRRPQVAVEHIDA